MGPAVFGIGPTGFLMVADMADKDKREQMMQGAMPGGTPMGLPPGMGPEDMPPEGGPQGPLPDGLPPGSGPESLPSAGPLDRWNALIGQALTARSRSEAAIAQLYAGHPASQMFGK